MPAVDHGDPGNIVMGELAAAAVAGGTTVTEAAWNIPRTLTAAGLPDWPPALGVLHGRPAVAFDCDGILAFTAEALATAINAKFGSSHDPGGQSFFPGTLITTALPYEQGVYAAALFRDPVFLCAVAPDWRAVDTMNAAVAAGFEVLVVTERPPEMREATVSWLDSWGASVCDVYAVGHGGKSVFMHGRYGPSRPAVLIDDNPAARLTVASDGIDVWTPERPYTPAGERAHTRTFTSWPMACYWLGLSPRIMGQKP
jgi:hypothetical protein